MEYDLELIVLNINLTFRPAVKCLRIPRGRKYRFKVFCNNYQPIGTFKICKIEWNT